MTISRDLIAARNRTFAPVMELVYSGEPLPLTGASISMQVRLYAGQEGEPLAEDAAVIFSDAVDDTDASLRVLTVEPVISKLILSAMPSGLNEPEVGVADRFSYEITLTYADSMQDTLWTGAFQLEPGVDDT